MSPAGSAAFAANAPRDHLTHTCYAQMAHEIFNEPDRELPIAELTRWLSALPQQAVTQDAATALANGDIASATSGMPFSEVNSLLDQAARG